MAVPRQGIAVRGRFMKVHIKPAVLINKKILNLLAGDAVPAVDANDISEIAVKFQYPAAAGLVVQPVNVLGHEMMNETGNFQPDERNMRRIRPGIGYARPADHTARPVFFSDGFA